MIIDRNIDRNAQINPSKIAGGVFAPPAAKTYYVDRNVGSSGDGSSWQEAFKTVLEAVTQINADYTAGAADTYSRGRMRRLYIAEGYYIELPMTLTANDVHIVGAAPGTYDSTVLFGSSVAGTATATAGGPALTVTGSNNTIEGMGFFTWDANYSALRLGANPSDPDTPTRSGPLSNVIRNCSFTKDGADLMDGGILSYDIAGTLIEWCTFATSCKTYGVKIDTNGVNNPIDPVVRFCKFTGTPTGILMAAGHNGLFWNNWFMNDTSDTADTCDTPIVINGTSAQAWNNWAQGVNAADVVTGSGTISEIRNWGDDS